MTPLRRGEKTIHYSLYNMTDVILFLLHQAAERQVSLTIGEICDCVFIADHLHVNRRGWPVIFDRYVALPEGPVPQHLFGLLAAEPAIVPNLGPSTPWRRTASVRGTRYDVIDRPMRQYASFWLNESCQGPLAQGLSMVREEKEEAHRILRGEAFTKAWESRQGDAAPEMDCALFGDPPHRKDICELAQYAWSHAYSAEWHRLGQPEIGLRPQ